MVFSDGGSTTIAPKSGITARQLLTSVATRRGLSPGKQNREQKKNILDFIMFYGTHDRFKDVSIGYC